jgi:hypothetical protein
MSDKQQTPTPNNNVKRSLLLIIAAILVGAIWFVWQSNDNTDKSLKSTKKTQTQTPTETVDTYKGWKSYTWTAQGVSFKYPGDWTVQENTSMGRLYVKNSTVDLAKEQTPENFQQLWLSVDTDETAAARETNIKKGVSAFREVIGEVKASTIKAGSLTINVYEYETTGGPTLEAYWTNKAGSRVLATNSTEVGQQNQKDMVANLKKLLASVTLPQ